MTTQITTEANPRLPKPDRYRAHIDKILPDDARPPLPRWLPRPPRSSPPPCSGSSPTIAFYSQIINS